MLRRFFRFSLQRGRQRNETVKSGRFSAASRPSAPTMDGNRHPLYLTAEEHAAWSQARYALQQFPSENP